MNRQQKVIMTGATGFIGSHIIECFIDNGINPICYIRKSSDISLLQNLGLEFRYGDVQNESDLIEAFKGCNFVIHNAALVNDWSNNQSFYAMNVLGTENILKACLKNGITNIIITGSISSYGEEDCRMIKDENCEDNSHYRYFLDSIFPCRMNNYRDSKAEATRIAVNFARKHKLNLTILEPVWVYGEREFNTGFYSYIKSVKDGLFCVPGSRKNKFHVVYARDLARAYWLAYQKKLTGVHRIIIGNKNVELMDNIYAIFCKESGFKKPKLLPKWLTYPIGFLLELVYTVFRIEKPPLLTRGRINMFYDNIEFCTKKGEDLLGFRSDYSLEQGVKQTVKWYKENHYI